MFALTAMAVVAVVFAGLFTYAYVAYSSDIAVTVHGMVRVANGYGSPYMVDFFTNAQQLPFHEESATIVTPLNDNSTAYFSVVVISGHEYNIIVTVSAPGKGAVNNCALVLRNLPGCTICLAPRVPVPFATTDYNYNITVACPGP
jgi:hypothetical protein